ncbi:hypothetical protein [Vibrio fluvialis]|uniref:hypothetical protein n=1 Tax=Vibrio fluvialis TaxID=676 RepID=UPI00399B0142
MIPARTEETDHKSAALHFLGLNAALGFAYPLDLFSILSKINQIPLLIIYVYALMYFSEYTLLLKRIINYLEVGMLTKIGGQILDELKSELDTDVEDRKRQFLFIEAGNTVKSLWQLVYQFLSVFYFYLSGALLVSLAFIDESTINTLRSVPVGDVISFKNQVIYSVFAVSLIGFFVVFVGRKLNNFKTAKEQYQSENTKFVRDTTRQIELIEEVLHRHHLINKKEL